IHGPGPLRADRFIANDAAALICPTRKSPPVEQGRDDDHAVAISQFARGFDIAFDVPFEPMEYEQQGARSASIRTICRDIKRGAVEFDHELVQAAAYGRTAGLL